MTESDIQYFAEPPRPVPLLLRLKVYSGGWLAQSGWIFFGFGMIFFWSFVVKGDYTSWWHFRGPLRTAMGTITSVAKTDMSKGGGDADSGTHVFAYHYRFTDPAGTERTGVSYRLVQAGQVGDQVAVEFPAGKPHVSRIKGMRRAPEEAWVVVVSVFPAIGLGALIFTWVRGRKTIRLLGHGLMAFAQMKSKTPTNMTVNNEPVYKLIFEFSAEDGTTHQAIARTHRVGQLEDQPYERVLYDPLNPSYSAMFDVLPGDPIINSDGNLRVKPVGAVASLLLPLIVLIGHGTHIYLAYVK